MYIICPRCNGRRFVEKYSSREDCIVMDECSKCDGAGSIEVPDDARHKQVDKMKQARRNLDLDFDGDIPF